MLTTPNSLAPLPLDIHERDALRACLGRLPRTLEEVLMVRAEIEHRRRLAEIRTAAPKLALLSEFLPALAERGILLTGREIHSWNGKELRIRPNIMTRDDKLFDALVAMGFSEVERKKYTIDDIVTLKKGRSLLVIIEVTSGWRASAAPDAPLAALTLPADS